MEDKEDDKKQGSCEQRWSHKFVNDTWPREKRRQPRVCKRMSCDKSKFFLGTFTYIDIDGMQNFDLTHKNYDE